MSRNYNIKKITNLARLIKSIVDVEINNDNMVVVHRLVDFSKTKDFKKKRNISYTAIYAKAIAKTIMLYPEVNKRLIPLPIIKFIWPVVQHFKNVDIAVAAERTKPGMESIAFLDILRDAEEMSLEDIYSKLYSMRANNELNNNQWRDFQFIAKLPYFIAKFLITLPIYIPGLWVKYRGGCALISSPGKYGMDTITTSWTAPLGFSYGIIEKRPLVVNDKIEARESCHLVMSFDRRLLAGRAAGLVFNQVIEFMKNPELLESENNNSNRLDDFEQKNVI